jgi:serine/threonine protein kinase
VPIIDADEYDGQIVIVSEYAPDGSLEEWLKMNGAMPVQRAIETTIQILDGLEFLHSRHIIHRDLKPANILLQGTTPRLADFGISRALRTTVASQSQNISGTFAYMSPEALDGKRPVQTDVWSVGVNLYQFLTGPLPFPQKEPSVLFPAIIMREFAPLPDSIPQNLKNVVAKALAKLPENRYKTAGEMREDLHQVLHNKSISLVAKADSSVSEVETIVKPKISSNQMQNQDALSQPSSDNSEKITPDSIPVSIIRFFSSVLFSLFWVFPNFVPVKMPQKPNVTLSSLATFIKILFVPLLLIILVVLFINYFETILRKVF